MLYICTIRNKQIEIMTYLHYLTDKNGNQIESVYSNNDNKKMSLEAMAKIKNATYKIWNRKTNEILTIGV